MSKKTSNDDSERPQRPLSSWERFFSGLFGLAAIGTGATTAFFSDVEAGPTALIIIGAILLIMAITGSPVRSARVGDSEFILAAREKLQQVIEDNPNPENVESALRVAAAYDRNLHSSLVTHRVTDIAHQHRDYEQMVKDGLSRLFRDAMKVSPRSNGKILDFLVTKGDASIVVQTLFRPLHYSPRPSTLNLHVQVVLDSEYDCGVIVTNMDFPEQFIQREMERAKRFGKQIKVVCVRGQEKDWSVLSSAIDELASS